MIMAVFLLNSTLERASRESQEIGEIAALEAVGSKAKNIERMVIDLDQVEVMEEINERRLPFSYELDKDAGRVAVQQDLPLGSDKLEGFFDLINLLEVFLEDADRDNVFDGLVVEVDTLKNSDWSGTDESLSFLVEPFCYEYVTDGLESMLFRESSSEKCLDFFQNSDFERLDLDLTIQNSDEDFDEILCDGGSCPEEDYNPSHPQGWPYYRIQVLNCELPNCTLAQTVVSEHFDPEVSFDIAISCTGGECVSDPINISHSSLDFSISHSSDYTLDVGAQVTFNDSIESFYFLGFDATVSHFNEAASKSVRKNPAT